MELSIEYKDYYLQHIKDFDSFRWDNFNHYGFVNLKKKVENKLFDIFSLYQDLTNFPPGDAAPDEVRLKNGNILQVTYIYDDHVIYCDCLKTDIINIPINWLDMSDEDIKKEIKNSIKEK